MITPPPSLMENHWDAVHSRHRFQPVAFRGEQWALSHLDPFALRVPLPAGPEVDLVVFFSCHCFTHEEVTDERYLRGNGIPAAEYYSDDRETRVLSPERYKLSREHLPTLIRELPTRLIRVQGARSNYFTVEATSSDGVQVSYVVFFEIEKDKARRKRLLLRVQSAFPMPSLIQRLAEARKVRFEVLLNAAYQGRRIRG